MKRASMKRALDDDADAANVDDVAVLFDDLEAQEHKRARVAKLHHLHTQDACDAKVVDDVSDFFSSLLDDAPDADTTPQQASCGSTFSKSSSSTSFGQSEAVVVNMVLSPTPSVLHLDDSFGTLEGCQPHKRGVVYCEVSFVSIPRPASVLPVQPPSM
ncbi:hypothetical protein SDRG_08842 [Saprolegnia diclina VS20]|uniref:Uncharacterized protein n=1 Tax=Saprolegnia diclina (strain VS20) TaxID=1156394 RepID=T0QJ12_SAPDV|nr:hypothetical protein SDRG_08842 [Saprolegnia diclina VS20]EQC33740.1 hypothetical protein SDRG_08842 [Saprolegnia diclina VS20]|eukprot:XP_008612963.1 hypothetical protein SDRG_08842 [Saprolegnia diclina VS20]